MIQYILTTVLFSFMGHEQNINFLLVAKLLYSSYLSRLHLGNLVSWAAIQAICLKYIVKTSIFSMYVIFTLWLFGYSYTLTTTCTFLALLLKNVVILVSFIVIIQILIWKIMLYLNNDDKLNVYFNYAIFCNSFFLFKNSKNI